MTTLGKSRRKTNTLISSRIGFSQEQASIALQALKLPRLHPLEAGIPPITTVAGQSRISQR